jgi:hypothetical protein
MNEDSLIPWERSILKCNYEDPYKKPSEPSETVLKQQTWQVPFPSDKKDLDHPRNL